MAAAAIDVHANFGEPCWGDFAWVLGDCDRAVCTVRYDPFAGLMSPGHRAQLCAYGRGTRFAIFATTVIKIQANLGGII